MAVTVPLTLLTLPPEVREIIWDYCLVSPTRRILPVYYNLPAYYSAKNKSSIPSSPFVWTAPLSLLTAYTAARRTAFSKILHLIPCALTTATPLSLSLFPLANYLPRVNRQVYVETSTRLWSKNTLVIPDHHTAKMLLEYLGKISLRVQHVELLIGNVWDLMPEQMTETLDELLRLVYDGQLGKLRLQYVDGGTCHRTAFNTWSVVLYNNDRTSHWGSCEREVVWEENKMRTDKLRQVLARQWGLEGGWGWDEEWEEWDDNITDLDWMPVKKQESVE